MNRKIWAVACFFTMVLAGCGYTTRSAISNQYRTIYVTPFLNKIEISADNAVQSKYKVYRPKMETDITRAVSDKYLFDGNLKPVSEQRADVTLKGELVEFVRDPVRYDSNDEVQEYRINIRVNLKLWDNRSDQAIWEEESFTGDTTYFTPGHLGSKSDDTAISDAVADLARRIVERTVEDW